MIILDLRSLRKGLAELAHEKALLVLAISKTDILQEHINFINSYMRVAMREVELVSSFQTAIIMQFLNDYKFEEGNPNGD